MAVTRIKNNQVTDASGANTQLGINANTKIQNFSITSAKLANNLTYGSDLTITGNLTVQGNTTSIDTTITTIEDPIIVLASTQTSGAPVVDIGFLGFRGNESNIAFVWDESASSFVTAFTSTAESNTTITITSLANLQVGNLSLTGNILNTSLNVTGNITGGNLLTPGLISATSTITSAANITGANILTGGVVSATANVTGGNVLTGGLISATSTITSAANITGGNVLTGGLISATSTITSAANITGGNLLTGGLISATSTITSAANITGGNVLTGGLISATANVTGGNLLTGGLISATSTITSAANIIGGNLLTGGLISATSTITTTSNITGGNILFGSGQISGTGNVYASNFIGNIAGNIDAAGANTQVQFNDSDLLGASAAFTFDKASNALVNSGNITGGNLLTAGLISATSTITSAANVTGGNLLTGGLISATSTITSAANITGGNILTGGLVSATANVTGGNLLTGGLVSATANVTGGNILTAGIVSAGGNVIADNVVTDNVVSSGAMTITTASNGNINIQPNGTGNIVLSNTYINSVRYPEQDQDAASKIYVDNLVSTAISYHEAVVAATTGNLDVATGGTVTYAQPNGVANGIGATLTTTGSFNLIDTANVQSANTRILVKDQANAVQNGVYVWSNATVITRSLDTDTYGAGNINALGINDYFFTTSGNVNKGTAFVVDEPTGTITFGTSNIGFAIFSQTQVYTANTLAGLVLNGTEFSAKVDNNTTAFDGSGNIIVKAGANLTTPNIGAATGTSLNVTANVTGGNITTAGLITATGNVTGGNVLTGGLISATSTITSAANITGGNVLTGGVVSATANITGGNVLTGGVVSATANVTGGNLLTGGLISATSTITSAANITGGNLLTGGLISATANITGGNILSGGLGSFTGNVTAANFIGNISGNIDAGGANTNIQFNDSDILAGSAGFTFDKTSNAVVANGNITGSNFNTAGVVTATGNVTGGNVLTGGLISATSTITSAANITGGNLLTAGLISATSTITSAANVIGGNISTGGLVTATGNVTGGNLLTGGLISATANITGANLILTTGIIDGPAAGRITINGSDIDTDFAVDGDTLANVFYVDAGTGTASFGSSTQVTNAIVNFDTTTSFKAPVGNTAQRPATGVTGMIRFNTTSNSVEVYDNSQWVSVGVPVFTVIDDEQFNGDGTTVAFTLGSTQTTNSCIVSINGVVQVPTVAYSVSGTDPTCVLTFTEAPLTGDLIDVREITTTTSVTQISNSPGNAIIATSATTAQIDITGNLVPTSNITFDLGTTSLRWNDLYLAGNSIVLGNTVIKNTSGNSIGFFGPDGTTPATIDAASVDTTTIANGTSNVKVVSANGNVTTSVGGTSNVMVISSTDVSITGNLSVSGNATLSGNILGDRIQNGTTQIDIQTTGGNANITVGGTSNVAVFATTGAFITGVNSVTGNVTGGNVLTGGLISATGAITGAALTGTSLTVSTGNITGGNLLLSGAIIDSAQLDIQTSASNSNIALAPNGTGIVTVSTQVSAVGNVTGGNIRTAGLISATGAITGAALTGTSLTVSTGNVSCGNIVNTNANGVGNIGSTGTRFNQVFALASSAQYADLAEKYTSDATYATGTVVAFGGDQEVTISATDSDRRVAGVISALPSFRMNDGLQSEHTAMVALTGRVPTLVTGPVRKGDMMVSAGAGRARAEANPEIGTVIGKALADHDGADGVIEVVVGRV